MKILTAARLALSVGVIGGAGFIEPDSALAQSFKTSCENLASVALPDTRITSARLVAAGAFTPPGGTGTIQQRRLFASLPAFCRIEATASPVSASTIHMEVWLPSNWNGTFQGEANGLWGGAIVYGPMGDDIRTGAATAASDDGHVGAPNLPPVWYNWQTHPEQIIDFSWRAFHYTTLDAKALIAAYYNAPLTLSYLIEPSGRGSRQTMKEMQQFPEDYDAIVTGGLAAHQTHHPFGQQWVWQAVHKSKASYIPPEKYPAIHQAALSACDAKDGVKDGVIADPAHCRFDPGVLLCKGEDAPTCLTAPQVEAAREIYKPAVTSDTHKVIFGPLMPGSELGWAAMAGPKPFAFGTQILAYLVFKQGESWDPKTLKFDSRTVALADAPENNAINAWNPDISVFLERGGKLLIVGGWNDTLIDPGVNVDYYQEVLQTVGPEARNSVRLFMVPGMSHSPGRVGPYAYDIDLVATIKKWKSTNQAPESLVFTHWVDGAATNKVLVCAYPLLAIYKGSGDTKDPSNYACRPGAPVGWESRPRAVH